MADANWRRELSRSRIGWLTGFALSVFLAPQAQGQQTGTVTGTVSHRDGSPLPAVVVGLEREDGTRVGFDTTSADGSFRIAAVAPGSYTAIVQGEGSAYLRERFELAAGSEVFLQLVIGVYYLEHIIVKGERGEQNLLERPMSVSGFNQEMVIELGMNNNNDLEALVPALQLGHRAPDSGHGNHIYLRGIGSQRHQEFFSDVAVATYVNGIYTDELYGLEPGNMWDVERIEIARGPQGTTGGKAAIAGSISYETIKPTERWDFKSMIEATDQFSQRYNVALGGPIGSSGFRWRFTGGRWVGDGAQQNIGSGGDYDAPDQISYAAQARYVDTRLDVNLSYSRTDDRGAPRTSVELYGRDVSSPCLGTIIDPNGNPLCVKENPFFGSENQAPSVANCDVNDPKQIICDGSNLRNIVDYNRPGITDSYLSAVVLDAKYQLTDALQLSYKGGYRESENDHTSDTDGNSRIGSVEDPFVAADGKSGGSFVDTETNYLFYSEQHSHEVSLSSSFDGPFQFGLGAYYRTGDEPYKASLYDYATRNFNIDTSATCEAVLPSLGFPLLSEHGTTSAQSAQGVWACPGELSNWSNTGRRGVSGGNYDGLFLEFYGHSTFETVAAYFNAELDVGRDWTFLGGLRFDRDTKSHVQNDIRIGLDLGFAADLWWFRNQDVEGFEAKRDARWNQLTWNIGFAYSPRPEELLYGRVSKGGRAGGFAGLHTFTPELMAFDSEAVINYEVGFKGLLFDGAVQLATSAFYLDYQRYWVSSSARLLSVGERVPGGSVLEEALRGFGQAVAAIPGTWIAGVELEGAYRFGDRATLRGFYSFMSSAIGEYKAAYCCDPLATTETFEFVDREGNVFTEEIRGLMDFTGNSVPMQPKHKASITAIYDLPSAPQLGELMLVTTLGYTSSKHPDISNIPRFKIPSYTRWDARVMWVTPFLDNLQVHLFAKNLLNEIGVQQWRPIEMGGANPRGSLTDPREIGLQLVWGLGKGGR